MKVSEGSKSLFGKSIFGHNYPHSAANHSPFVTVSRWIQLLTLHGFRSNVNNSISKETFRTGSKGATLLEVLIVASVVAMIALTILITVNVKDQLAKGRDGRRKADLVLLSQKLEDYYNDYDEYPASLTCNNSFTPYLTKIPCDPRGPSYTYLTTTGQEYQIYTTLEYKQDPVIVNSSCNSACGPDNQYNYGVSSPNIGL